MNYKIIFCIITCFNIFAVNSQEEETWIEFKDKFEKSYTSLEEDAYRYSIFLENLKRIRNHNARYENGKETYFLGVNKFSDLTRGELSPSIVSSVRENIPKLYHGDNLEVDLPDSFDWRDKGAVLGVKEQGDCYGASVAFSVTGAIEGRNIIKHGKNIELSPQCLLDCAGLFGDFSCDSYEAANAYNYIASQGIAPEASYPYVGRIINATCEMNVTEKADLSLRGYLDVYPKEKFFMKDLVQYGPISVRISTDPTQDYSGGVFNAECYNEYNSLAGGMLLVGYGSENGTDYWTLRNSWGTAWGEEGYIRLARNGDVGLCGIYTNSRYPWLEGEKGYIRLARNGDVGLCGIYTNSRYPWLEGEKGYIRLARNGNVGLCGIYTNSRYPWLEGEKGYIRLAWNGDVGLCGIYTNSRYPWLE